MSISLPESGPAGPTDESYRRRTTGTNRSATRTVEDVLRMLEALNGMVLMRVVSPGVASVIGRNLKTMLEALRQQAATGQGDGLSQETLETILHDAPHLVGLLEPFLTDEQIDWVLQRAKGDQP